MGPDGVGLKDHTDVAVVWIDKGPARRIEDGLAAQANLAAVGPLETGHTAQRRGFAATRRAEKSEELALLNRKIDPSTALTGWLPRTLKSLVRL